MGSTGGGTYAGIKGSGGGTFMFYPDAKSLDELQGEGVIITASAYPFGFGGGFRQTDSGPRGFGLNIGIGEGISLSGFKTRTGIRKLPNLGTAIRAVGYINSINSNVRDSSFRNNLIRSIINTAFSGNSVKWYYNSNTGNYQ